ncbi:MAG TPA: cell division protein ZapE, partial [Afifellaceae bacterium]|nr:cell division protein ZapE [Afifellaceae bacterium]
MSASVRQRYDAMIASGDVAPDAAQRALAARLDRLLDEIAEKRLSSKKSAPGWIFARGGRP